MQRLSSTDDFARQGTPSEGILGQTAATRPVLSPEWFEACLRAYGKGKKPALRLAVERDKPTAIAPLWRYHHVHRNIPLLALGFINVHDSPFVDFVVSEEHRAPFLDAVLRSLFDTPEMAWDLLRLTPWPAKSPNRPIVQSWLEKERKKYRFTTASIAPVLALDTDWDSFLRSRSSKFRKTRRNIVNRIQCLRDLELECHRNDPAGNVLKDVIAVSEKSWKSERHLTMTQQEGALEFFRLLTKNAGKYRWPMIWLLKTEGRPIAMEYDLECDGVVHALRADYDQAYSRFSPGAYLEYEIIERLSRGGFRQYRSGPGLNDYKLRWTDETERNETMLVYNTTPRGMLAWAADKVVDELKHRLPSDRRKEPIEERSPV